jgi:hypothetical protein
VVGPALDLGVIGDLGIGVKVVWDKFAEELGGSYGIVEVKKVAGLVYVADAL